MTNGKAPVPRIEQEEPVIEQEERVTQSAQEVVVSMVETEVPTPTAEPEQTAPRPKAAPKSEVKTKVSVEAEDEAPYQATPEAPAAASPQPSKDPSDVRAKAAKLFSEHEYAVLGGIAGLVVAVLMFTMGFWKTLFITLLVAIGIAFGQLIDGDPKIINAIRRLIDDLRSDNR